MRRVQLIVGAIRGTKGRGDLSSPNAMALRPEVLLAPKRWALYPIPPYLLDQTLRLRSNAFRFPRWLTLYHKNTQRDVNSFLPSKLLSIFCCSESSTWPQSMVTRTWLVILPRNILGVESEFSLGHGLFAALVLRIRTYMVFLRLYITPDKLSYARISCWFLQVQENFFHRNERDNNIQPFKFGGHKSGNVLFG